MYNVTKLKNINFYLDLHGNYINHSAIKNKITYTTAFNLTKLFEEKGLLEKRRVSQRVRIIYLTSKGKTVQMKLLQYLKSFYEVDRK